MQMKCSIWNLTERRLFFLICLTENRVTGITGGHSEVLKQSLRQSTFDIFGFHHPESYYTSAVPNRKVRTSQVCTLMSGYIVSSHP